MGERGLLGGGRSSGWGGGAAMPSLLGQTTGQSPLGDTLGPGEDPELLAGPESGECGERQPLCRFCRGEVAERQVLDQAQQFAEV